jgi:hypothetical protein
MNGQCADAADVLALMEGCFCIVFIFYMPFLAGGLTKAKGNGIKVGLCG